MIVAPTTYNWEESHGPLAGLGGLLSGNGKGFLTQVANAFNAASGGDGKSGLIGLFAQGRHNRDDAKIRYDTDVTAGMKNADAILGGIGQYRNADGTYDIDKLKADPTVMGLLADNNITNITNDNLGRVVDNTNSWKNKFGDHTQMGYAQQHTLKEYNENPYEAYDPNRNFAQPAQDSQVQASAPTSSNGFFDYSMTNPFTGLPLTPAASTPDAGQLMQAATQVDQTNLPTRDSTLSKNSQEEGQKATQEAVNKGMEAANKGPGLLGSMLKGAVVGLATGGSGWAGALNGAKSYGLNQLGGLGQLYGAYQGIKDATKGNGTPDTQMMVQNPMDNWQNYSLTQPMGYRVGDYTRSFARNNGYGGLF